VRTYFASKITDYGAIIISMDDKTKSALIKAVLIIGGAILLAVFLYTLFHPLHIKVVSENVIKLIAFNM